ncbi:ACP S-malonyltransferase [Clostridium sp. D2Q-14]|uniref:ACP S-malonyltransferase n=1 Tax=Anaeromonas gelatinilytica TaxID=2683194 RepID=UPI00193B2A65|nr:ACP S-malonyltransferase [Anaeromonas gelatinilytica]MBS4536695.1 ACP S-malonyltransferase [Anaeromonas gelatinilytica]
MFEIAEEITGLPLKELLLTVSNIGNLKTNLAQPLIFMLEYSKYQYYSNKIKEKPTALLGHSLGEITALTVAGGIAFEDALILVKERGRLMNDITNSDEGMMAIIGAKKEHVDEICKSVSAQTGLIAVSANYNSQTQTVISGNKEALELVSQRLEDTNIKYLNTSCAFHSPIMKNIEKQFQDLVHEFEYKPLKIPVISSTTGISYAASWSIPYILTEQIYSPIKWVDAMEYLIKKGVLRFLQVSESTLFQTFDSHLGMTLTWDNYETIRKVSSYNFDKLYTQSSKNLCYSTPIIGECLHQMIAYKWRANISEKSISEAQKSYDIIMNLYSKISDKEIEPTKEQIYLALDEMDKVLSLKNIKPSKKIDIQKMLLSKYGIEKMRCS